MIRNNQRLKDLSPGTLKKAKSEDKKKNPLPKVVVKKDKLIFKFLKSKTEKEELQKMKEELKQSMQTVESHEAMSSQEYMEQSMFVSQVENNPSPLTVEIAASVGKIAIAFVLNERGPQYDHIFEANLSNEEIP